MVYSNWCVEGDLSKCYEEGQIDSNAESHKGGVIFVLVVAAALASIAVVVVNVCCSSSGGRVSDAGLF